MALIGFDIWSLSSIEFDVLEVLDSIARLGAAAR
jgi:hypothetical protein